MSAVKSAVPCHSSTQAQGGYRMVGMELYNWGTFHRKVWHVDLGGAGALLTGPNGSGKSTLVDALLTLLVPNKRRNYNLASGSEKRERNETSYVKGAFQRESVRGIVQVKYLREETEISALSATFHSESIGERLTLAQFFWFEAGNLKKIYVVSHQNVAIKEALGMSRTPKDLRKRLAALPDTFVFATFQEYEAYFVQTFGLRSPKAMDLFNQITAIKQIGSLNEFVREHMLEGIAAGEFLEPLHRNYEDLTLAHQAIVIAKRQLTDLTGIESEAQNLHVLDTALSEFDAQQKHVLRYFTELKIERLTARAAALHELVSGKEFECAGVDTELNVTAQKMASLLAAQSKDSVSQQLERIGLLLEQLAEKEGARSKALAQYQQLANRLGCPLPATAAAFAKNRRWVAGELCETEKACAGVRESMFALREKIKSLSGQMAQNNEELRTAARSQNQVPAAYLRLRDAMCDFLSVPKSKLPFLAELMAVNSKEKAWEPAIERLLHGVALRLAVHDDLFKEASRFLKSRHVGLRITLVRISDGLPAPQPSGTGPELVWEKLLFRPQTKLAGWARARIARDFPLRCCIDLREFHRYEAALTQEGLIKRNSNTVEKDDRRLITDRSQFVLGWTNEDKIELLQTQGQVLQKEVDAAQKQSNDYEKQLRGLTDRLGAIQALELCADFEAIDVDSLKKEAKALLEQQTLLLGKSNKVADLKRRIDATQRAAAALKARRDALLSELGALKSEAQHLPVRIRQATDAMTTLIGASNSEYGAAQREQIDKLVRQRKFSLGDAHVGHFDLYAHQLQEDVTQKRRKKAEQRQTASNSLIRKMTQFKAAFPEYSTHLDATHEAIGDFVLYKRALAKEALPEHEARFRALLNKSTLNDVTAFKSTLEGAFEQIEGDVEHLNHSLKAIPYTDSTYVQIEIKRTRDSDVREFQNMLSSTIKGHNDDQAEAALEETFHRVKIVLDRLKRDGRWCNKVTDVRNWADFLVVERNLKTGEQTNVYSDSAGLSGGQKAKLAFTILGSALSYQYGLNQAQAATKSFRFVVIDEAFSKSDDKNSQYALELFKRLGLQLMVVTPSDKIHVIEPYVKKIFLTQMAAGGSTSGIYSISIEQFAGVSRNEPAHARSVH